MIALVLEDRCDGCGACVAACPTNVLDLRGKVAAIARQQDCQTCFLCELYCPQDALYVEPTCDRAVPVVREEVSELIGRFRRDSGWHEWAEDPRYPNEHWRMAQVFAEARKTPPPSG